MITAKPTKNLTGITIEGDFLDFYEIVESIYRMTISEDVSEDYEGCQKRLLGMCYDIRHAYMGDREVRLADNGVHDAMLEWHSADMPQKEVRFSDNFLFPEAVFVALSVKELCIWARRYYGLQMPKEASEVMGIPPLTYAEYIRDKAILETLSAVILGALAEVIGDEALEKLINLRDKQYGRLFYDYAGQYVDKCNIEYLKTVPDKRKDKIRNIAKRFINPPVAYQNLKRDLRYAAEQYHCSIHELQDPRLEYPEEIEW